ncbi:response regulator [Lyngbya confervoides]|uniref:histidine kinase n=1 Tax=Lyngbya confervoides BDU141951 TaxID=1574623 RepID=A0ABD4T900_9CYAN|nr:response regulator [Lyngbya confervoides]MCM1984960.1 response regulator [Lyngbya confervoides BDU141951]
MAHAIHQAIQVYQDFHRQTLDTLRLIEQDSYKLMPCFDLEQIFGLVEHAHQIKAGARRLGLRGLERLAHQLKGRYLTLFQLPPTLERELLKQLIQCYELLRLCLLTDATIWQRDLATVMEKMPEVLASLDASLPVCKEFRLALPGQEALQADIQRLLVATVLTPELARLEMMITNTPASKLADILTSQIPRLSTLAQQLQILALEQAMRTSLIEIQAHPHGAKGLATAALANWSDLCHQCVTQPGPADPPRAPAHFQNRTRAVVLATEVENHLVDLAVALVTEPEATLLQRMENDAARFLALAQTYDLEALATVTDRVNAALKTRPHQVNWITRLAIQEWLWAQCLYLVQQDPAAVRTVADTLIELTQPDATPRGDIISPDPVPDPYLLQLLEQMYLPDGFDPQWIGRPDLEEDLRRSLPSVPRVSSAQRMLPIAASALADLARVIERCREALESNAMQEAQQHFQQLLTRFHRMRSLKLRPLLARFEPMVDALGFRAGKDIRFHRLIGDIEVDKAVGEQIYELLLPLVANAILHGLETPEERHSQEKAPQGNLFLSVYAQGEGILIELRDDGRGLNFQLLRRLLKESRRVSAAAVDQLSEQALLAHLFQPSPPEDRGEMSHGFDLVRRTLRDLRGNIEVATLMNQGTTFRIRLPQVAVREAQLQVTASPLSDPAEVQETEGQWLQAPTLRSSVEFLGEWPPVGPKLSLSTAGLFLWSDQRAVYVLSCDRIEEYVMPHITEAHQGQAVLTWRRRSLPIYTLHDFLGFADASTLDAADAADAADSQSRGQHDEVILILIQEMDFIALRSSMEQLVNQPQLEIYPLAQVTAVPRYIYGATVIGDQPPRLVIDVAALIDAQRVTTQATYPLPQAVAEAAAPEPEDPSPLMVAQVMVVDDSRTAREIVSMTLRQGGYRVIQAKDGQDALEQLRGQVTVDLVISDVAMPRMNGLELIRQCRQDERLRSLPIAMLSHCDSATHSDLAMKAGANAYLTKPYEETEFLNTIAALLQAPVTA